MADDIPKYEDTAAVNPASDIPKYEDTHSHSLLASIANKVGAGINKVANATTEDFKDAGLGVVQGATFGGGDELTAGIQAATGLGDDNAKPGESFKDRYSRLQKDQQKMYDEAKARSPYAYGAGELAGNIGTAVATGGLGIEGAVGERLGAQGIKAAVTEGGGMLSGAVAKEAAKLAIASGAEAATVGALQGGLTAKQDQRLSGAETGAAIGGTLGAGGSLVGSAASATKAAVIDPLTGKLGQLVEDTPLLRQAKRAYDRGQAGNIISESAPNKAAVARQESDIVNNLSNQFFQAENQAGAKMGALLDDAAEKGVKVNVNQNIDDAATRLQAYYKSKPDLEMDKEYSDILNQVFMLKDGNLTPRQTWALKDKVFGLANKFDDPTLTDIANKFGGGVQESLNNSVPGYSQANNAFKSLRESGRETLNARGENPEFINKWIGDAREGQAKTAGDVKWLLEGLTSPGGSKLKQQQAMNYLVDNLSKAEEANPGTLKSLGYDSIDSFKQDLTNKADDFALSRSILGSDPQGHGGGSISSLEKMVFKTVTLGGASTGRGSILSTAQRAGALKTGIANSAAGKAASSVMQGAAKVYNWAPEQLGNLATKLQGSDNQMASQYGKMLQEGLQNSDSAKRNAALFVIQQNPNTRKLLDSDEDQNGGTGNEQQ